MVAIKNFPKNFIIKLMLAIIHQQSSNIYIKKTLQFFSEISESLNLPKPPVIVIVDNGSATFKSSVNSQFHIISSSNDYREFSAWEMGLFYLRKNLGLKNFNLILSNETMLYHRVFDFSMKQAFLEGFKYIFSQERPFYFGDVDLIRANPPYYNGSSQKEFVSTYLVAFNVSAVSKIKTFIFFPEIDGNFYGSYELDSVIKKSSQLFRSDYASYLENQFYKPSTDQKWYGFEGLSETNFNKMRLKLMSVVIEQSISQQIVGLGINIIDMKTFLNRGIINQFLYIARKIVYGIQWRHSNVVRRALLELKSLK